MTLEETNSSFDIDPEFIVQNQKLKTKRKGGPYAQIEKNKRMQEVHRLHFEYGYSARKISELMKVNRNTVNSDIDYWYSKIYRNTNILNPEVIVILNLERLEIQRSRLREQLDKTKTFQEKMALERLIYEIDCKILHIHNKLTDSVKRLKEFSTNTLNNWMKENKRDERYLTLYDRISVSKKARERIEKIIKEDRENR